LLLGTPLRLGFAGALLLFFASGTSAQERVGTTSQALTVKNIRKWTENGNVVPVCWETAGYDREKTIIKEAVSGTWEWFANIRFTGWGACPTGIGIGGSGTAKQVRIRITPQDGTIAGAGGATPGYGMDLLSS